MKMKKILAAVLAGVMALSATACSSSSTKKIESPDDFAGAKVSVQTGTTAHDALQKMQEEGVDVEILPYEKITQCFDDVSLGRADAVYVDSVVAAYYLADDDSKFQSVWKSDEGEPMGVCIKKGNTDLLEKAMRPALLGIIGCGAMGRLIARHIREQLPSYRLGGLFSRTTAHAEGLALELGDVPVLGLQQLIETCDLLVEATSAAAMPDIVRACLAAGKAVVPLSVGGFSLDPALLRDVEAARAAVHVPSGAIAGLDGIRAMREMGLDAVTLTTVKHPRSLGQMPPLSELIPPTAEEALIMSPEARLLFSGTAEEAIRRFPANVNVAVSLGLAGLGFSRTRVRLFADPCAAGTLHHISARAGDCTLETMTRPAPLPQNPRSSALAMYSVPALLRGLAANPKLAG